MRKALSVALLVMVLACSARAGVLIGDAVPPPPPPPLTGDMHTGDIPSPGDIPSTDGNIQTGAAATIVQVVLNLLALS